jgi:tetratricopeptide (TPR) repeat protein
MTGLLELRHQVQALVKAEQYSQALPIAQKLWDEAQPKDKWDGFNLAKCLRKIGRSEAALPVCQSVRSLDSHFAVINNLEGWCEYDIHVKPLQNAGDTPEEDGDEAGTGIDQAIAAVDRVLAQTKQEKFSPFTWMVLTISKLLVASGGEERARQALSYLDRLSPQLLETPKLSPILKPKDGTVSASEYENYALRRCKALLYAAEYAKCIDFANSELTAFPTRMGAYDIWLSYYRAKAFGLSGQADAACKELRRLVSMKPEWYMEHQIAEMEFQQGNVEQSWLSCVKASTMTGKAGAKVKLFTLMARVLDAKGDRDCARNHLLLHIALQREVGGRIREDVRELAISHQIECTEGKLEVQPSSTYMRELRPFWGQQMTGGRPRSLGRVKSLLDDRAGFIKTDDGTDIYFQLRDFEGPRSALAPGTKVSFTIVDSFDRKKGKASSRAELVRTA